MKILFYYTSNQRTVSIESVILGFAKQGHEVMLLTQTPKGDLHAELEKHGIKTYSHFFEKGNSFFYYLKHIRFLKKFMREHKPHVVYSHLQQANIVSVFAQKSVKAKFFICRHHTLSTSTNEKRFDKIINKRAKTIIVPSQMVYDHCLKNENVPSNKLKLIYYGYDFSHYAEPDPQTVKQIRDQYKTNLLLVKIARLVEGKRYPILFDAVNTLVKRGFNIKLLVISDGPLKEEFEHYISKNSLTEHIFLLGNKSNITDYLAAADAVPLLSVSEASNNVIKEAGLVKKCVIVCHNVGDFDDYITEGESGLFTERENPHEELKTHLVNLYNKKIDTNKMGESLHRNVMNRFSIENVLKSYDALNTSN